MKFRIGRRRFVIHRPSWWALAALLCGPVLGYAAAKEIIKARTDDAPRVGGKP